MKLLQTATSLEGVTDGLLEGRTLTRESNSEFTPRVSKLPTFPLLGFSRNNRQAQVLFRNQVREMLDGSGILLP